MEKKMTNNKLTDERSRLREAAKNHQTALAWYQSNIDSPAALQTWDAATSEFMAAIGNRETDIIADLLDEIDELQERRQADSEPIHQCEFCHHDGNGELQWHWEDVNSDFYDQYDSERRGKRRIVYAAPQPAPEREQIRRKHAEWSNATFGNVGPVGPLKHLSKEALETAVAPSDLSEWADMQFLLWDAQRRAGITDEQITGAMVEKLAINKARQWPEPKDGEPRLHIEPSAGLHFPTSDELAAAIAGVRCYDELSAELIAAEMFRRAGLASC